MTSSKIWAFVKLTRPVFLLGGALLYGLGVAAAAAQGIAFHLDRAVLGQLIVTATQLTAQYVNEYYDVETDRLNAGHRTWFSGGSGILPSSVLGQNVARRAALMCAVIAIIAIIAAGIQTPLEWVLGGAGLLAAWFYSAPPLSLAGSGWGELIASLVVALLVPFTGFGLQAGHVDVIVLIICLPLVLIHMAMLIAFEFPDWQADLGAGKKTLTVRWGLTGAATLHSILIVCAFVLLFIGMRTGLPAARFLWLALPLAIWQMIRVLWQAKQKERGFQALTLGAVSLFVLTSTLWLVGLVLE